MNLGIYLGKTTFLVLLDANLITKNKIIKLNSKKKKIKIQKLNVIQDKLSKINELI